jgi:hypothetical protein
MKPGQYVNVSKLVTSTTEFTEIGLLFCYVDGHATATYSVRWL